MKKLIVTLLLIVIVVTGCGKTDEEKEKMLYDSLEKAYVAVYAADGAGMAVYQQEMLESDGKKWFKVAISDYDRLEKLTMLLDVYNEEIKEEINTKLLSKYKEFKYVLYTTSEGGCMLDYVLGDDLKSKIKENTKIKEIKKNEIIFEYKDKKYTAKNDGEHYVFDEKIFECK